MRLRSRRFGFADNSVDAAEVGVLVETAVEDLLAQIARDVKAVFQNAVIHIDDVKAAVRSVVQVYWTKPLVGRGQEFRLVVGALRLETRPMFFEHVALDQIAGWLTHEDISVAIAWKIVAAIHQRRARGGERGQRAIGPQ